MNKKYILIFSLLAVIFFILTGNCGKEDDDTITDRDGNIYHTVTIGTQVWMVENLKTTHYNDGKPIPLITDSAEWAKPDGAAVCWYDNEKASHEYYGALYNWHAVQTGKLAPSGWHVPGDSEWIILSKYLIAHGYNYDGDTVANEYAKALAADTGWFSVGNIDCAVGSSDYPDKRNGSGFTGFPGGRREYNGEFSRFGTYGMWWSSSERYGGYAWYRTLAFDHCGFVRSWAPEENGFSVRCIKDPSPITF
jgi:uncharacterized protein (TIGR02145 family)